MKHSALWPILLLTLASIFTNACTDPSVIGADLLEGDRTRLEFFDTISISARVEEGPALVTHSRFNAFAAYLFGNMDDPIFGRSSAELFFQVLPRFADPLLGDNVIIDSVILNLPYNPNFSYGNIAQSYELAVRKIDGVIPNDNEYRTDTTFASLEEPLATATYSPRGDTVNYLSYNSSIGVTISLPTLRIPLSNDLGQEILNFDSLTRNSDDRFVEAFNGIHLQPTSVNQGIAAFNLTNPETGIFVYYRADSIARQYQLEVASASVKFMSVDHDFTGTPLGEALNDNNAPDSILFTQGLAGPITRIEFPFISNLRDQDLVINKAEIEVWVGDLPENNIANFPPGEQLLLAIKDENGTFVPIRDFAFVSNIPLQFGGVLTQEPGVSSPGVYRMNIGTHLQDMVDGVEPNELFLILNSKVTRAERTLLFGPNHPELPMKIRVTGTIITN